MVGDLTDNEVETGGSEVDGQIGTVGVGWKKQSRVVAARGVKERGLNSDELVTHVETMSKAVVELVKSMTGDKKELQTEELDSRVQGTVRKELEETKHIMVQHKDTIAELQELLRILYNRFE